MDFDPNGVGGVCSHCLRYLGGVSTFSAWSRLGDANHPLRLCSDELVRQCSRRADNPLRHAGPWAVRHYLRRHLVLLESAKTAILIESAFHPNSPRQVPTHCGHWRQAPCALDLVRECCDPACMFWIAVAAQITAPAPEAAKRWFSYNDVPQYLIARGSGLWSVPVRVTVEPTGRIHSCEVEVTGPFPQLNGHTCGIIRRRAKFRPATSGGAAAYGVYRTSISYAVADAPWDTSTVSSADIDVDVMRLPAGVSSPNLVRVAFAVDVNGGKTSCEADGTVGLELVNNHPALVSVACDLIMKDYKATPAKVSGAPVASIQNASVRFSAHPNPDK